MPDPPKVIPILEYVVGKATELEAGSSANASQHVETLLASSATTLAAMSHMVDGLSEIEDLEARRLAGVIAERLLGMRRAVAQFERYHKAVYGGGK